MEDFFKEKIIKESVCDETIYLISLKDKLTQQIDLEYQRNRDMEVLETINRKFLINHGEKCQRNNGEKYKYYNYYFYIQYIRASIACRAKYLITHVSVDEKKYWWNKSHEFFLSESFIRENADKLDWDILLIYQKFSEKFIEENAHRIDWKELPHNQKLSESFLEKYADKITWYWISGYHYLSEDFIEKHADKLDWHIISTDQRLSDHFIDKHANKLDWESIAREQCPSDRTIEKYIDKIGPWLKD